uniref:cytochrome b n=1 Tax=Austromenopon paululum TaxID=2965261 RepID=UPI0026E28C06|nr:cytochrome b [Austromenopon paululum]WJJ69874.1 cytochrome b [Austromenopon paululum]
MRNNFLKLPTPLSITYMWNFGSLLGACLSVQIMTGLFLAMHYSPSVLEAFSSVVHINNDVNSGWVIRYAHANGATLFFICTYLHIARGLIYKSFFFPLVWSAGVTLFLLFMGVAFLGYVLPWGQMSYWGATVITNLISAIPYLGPSLVEWVWGGFSVSAPTLSRFFALHFLLPFGGVVLVILHLLFLHEKGSSNPLGMMLNSDKVEFHPFFSVKDILGLVLMLFAFFLVISCSPFLFMDPDNFTESNPLVTPAHIQPEWYFLFAYAILRSIPSKLGGVLALLMSILILLILPLSKGSKRYNMAFFKLICTVQYAIFMILTWVGSLPVEDPYLLLGQISSLLYFMNFLGMTFIL